MPPTSTQSQLLRMYEAEAAGKASHARKRRFQRVIGLGLGGAGIATAMAGLPFEVSLALWGFGAASWAILKAV